jgi:hypothetical protein
MNYIEKLYGFKKVATDKIISRENTGFYLINGYNHKFDDIKQLEKIVIMIDKWNEGKKMVWNEITQIMQETSYYDSKKLSFREFILKTKIETSLINFKKSASNLKK